jgi:hypothetical protein
VLTEAADLATDYVERIILGIAAAEVGNMRTLAVALHASQVNHAPIWRLDGHLRHDYRAALAAGTGEAGRILLELWKLGDLP